MLTVQEAAQEAGVTEAAIRSAILRGRLPHVEKYGRKLITRRDFDAYRQVAKPGRPTGYETGRTREMPQLRQAEDREIQADVAQKPQAVYQETKEEEVTEAEAAELATLVSSLELAHRRVVDKLDSIHHELRDAIEFSRALRDGKETAA